MTSRDGRSEATVPSARQEIADGTSQRGQPEGSELLRTRPLLGTSVIVGGDGLVARLCGKFLGDAGAEVRRLSPQARRYGDDWEAFLDQGASVVEVRADDLDRLLERADVYLAGAAVTPAFGAREISRRHPQLVVVDLPAFGAGPYEAFAADDLVLSALSGLADCTPGFPDRQLGIEPPVQSIAPLAEFGAAVTAAVAAMGAIVQRRRGSEQPRLVEAASYEGVVWMLISDWSLCAYGGGAPGRRRKARTLEPNCYLRAADGYVVVVATSDRHWNDLVEIMGSPAWADERFASVEARADNVSELHSKLREWMSGIGARDFMLASQERGVPCAMYLELADAIASEHFAAVGAVERDGQTSLPADPIVLNGERRPRAAAKPSLSVRASGADGAAGERGPATPLEGIRILDLTQMVAGPFAGQLLAALGAEVILVESRRHLVSRAFGPFPGEPQHDASANFNHANRGKTSVEIDLKSREGRALLSTLVARSDIVLENLSRRAAIGLGLAYEELKRDREDIIVASISAFGRRGPWGPYVSHHGGVTALTGLASAIKDTIGEPRLVGAILPDVLTGSYLALAVLQAFLARQQTGFGCHIEVSMLDVLLNAMGGFVDEAARGAALPPHPEVFLPSAEEGRYLAVSAADLAAEPELRALVASMPRRQAMETLQARGRTAASVLDLSEVIADPHLRSRDFVIEDSHPVVGSRPLPAVPWLYDGRRPTLTSAPTLGNGTRSVLERLAGLTSEELDRLTDAGVLQ